MRKYTRLSECLFIKEFFIFGYTQVVIIDETRMMSNDLMSKDLNEKVDIVFEARVRRIGSDKGTHTPLVSLMKKVLQI